MCIMYSLTLVLTNIVYTVGNNPNSEYVYYECSWAFVLTDPVCTLVSRGGRVKICNTNVAGH